MVIDLNTNTPIKSKQLIFLTYKMESVNLGIGISLNNLIFYFNHLNSSYTTPDLPAKRK